MKSEEKIEVYQDLFFRGPVSNRATFRAVLVETTSKSWRHNVEQEEKIIAHTGTHDDVMVFERYESDGIDAVILSLWSYDDGFKVMNIVPREVGSLGEHRYNVALRDFLNQVANPAAKSAGFKVEVSPAEQGLDDWLELVAANALRQFSGAANKSTGSSHPADRQRWLLFLIAVHRDRSSLDTEILTRWFIEAEHWPPDIAQGLVSQYEFALDLLRKFDAEEL